MLLEIGFGIVIGLVIGSVGVTIMWMSRINAADKLWNEATKRWNDTTERARRVLRDNAQSKHEIRLITERLSTIFISILDSVAKNDPTTVETVNQQKILLFSIVDAARLEALKADKLLPEKEAAEAA